ncbi:MAG: transporter substrate-binding domain-containing protein [Chloroflexi bacterium]|nr:transporter substrate-binding domain-containing protein [Chloroflexota bacterium]MBU1747073.1 transporter substrate-binding domain-containing protein [Chloroflexota bacterium]
MRWLKAHNLNFKLRWWFILVLSLVLVTVLMYVVISALVTSMRDTLTPQDRAWLQGRGELRVAGDESFPPFEFVDAGEYRGFNVDLMRALELELGVPIRLLPMPWSQARLALEQGQVDAIQGMKRSPERESLYDFSIPHLISSQVLFVARDRLDVQRIEDLANHRVAVQAGDFADDHLTAHAPVSTEIVRVKGPEDALALLLDGTVDAVMLNHYVGLYLAQKNRVQNLVKIVGEPIAPTEYCMAVREGDTQLLLCLDKGLKAVAESGRKDQITHKWFGEPVGDGLMTAQVIQILLWGLAIIGALSIVLVATYVYNRLLRRQVTARTRLLQAERDFVQALFHAMGDGLVVMDAQGRFEMSNPAFYQMVGYTEADLVGRERFWMQPLSDAPGNLLETDAATSSRYYECQLLSRDGRVIDALVSETTRYSPAGAPYGRIAVYTDISRRKDLEDEIQHRLQVQQSLLETAVALQGTLNDQEILKVIADQLERLIEYDSLSFYLLDWDRRLLLPVLARGSHADEVLSNRLSVDEGVVGHVARHGQAETVADMRLDPRAVHVPGTPLEEPESLLAVPLMAKEIAIGVLAMYRSTERPFHPSEVELARLFANQAASTLENARLYAREQQRAAESLTLLDIARATNSTLDLTQVLQVVAQRAAQVCDAHRCTILLLGENGRIEPLMSQMASGELDPVLWQRFKNETFRETATEVDAVGQMIRQPGPYVFTGATLDHIPQHWLEPFGVQSVLALPLASRGEIIGIMALDYAEPARSFSAAQIDLAQAIAGPAAVAIQNARLYAQVQYRAVQLQIAAEISRVASSTLDPDHLLRQTVDLVRERFDFYYVGIFLADQTGLWTGEPGQWAVLRAGTGPAGQQLLAQEQRLAIGGDSMVGDCIASRESRIAQDVHVSNVVRFCNPLLPDVRSELALPLIARDQVIGAMTVQSDRTAAFSSIDITTLQTLADKVANAIENARLYDQVQQDIQELRKLDELKSDFVAMVSHELRAPLTSIIAYTETVLQGRLGLLTDQQRHALEVIVQSAYEQLRLIDDLLDLSRLDAGRMPLYARDVSLVPVVEDVLETLRPLAEKKGQLLRDQVGHDLPPVHADPDRLRQILVNLVLNGIKFTPEEGAITIAAQVVSDVELCVQVRDTGIGIAMADQALIFEKFTQVERPLTRQYRGAGLGLAIARLLVELHGGQIWVESEPGQGSVFAFTLPLAHHETGGG